MKQQEMLTFCAKFANKMDLFLYMRDISLK